MLDYFDETKKNMFASILDIEMLEIIPVDDEDSFVSGSAHHGC